MAMINTKEHSIFIGADEADYPMKLNYEVTKEKVGYGARITKTLVDEEGIEMAEQKTVSGFFYSLSNAKDLLLFLCERRVTPMTIKEATLEYLESKILII